MKILAIETSCDETAVALLDITGELEKPEIKILGNSLLSQVALHEQYGGVYPNLAKREHIKNLPILLEQTLVESGIKNQESEIDCIAVTSGPGLEPALWTGIEFAKSLSEKWGKPVVPVNHMEGHIYSVLYTESNPKSQILNPKSNLELPALALLISGGHTELVHIRDFGNYEIIGRTLDDAVGEAFDKVARMLGLPYPGGPQISRLAEKSRFRIQDVGFKLPRPMIHSKDLNFSFSGLKTAVLYKIRDHDEMNDEYREEMSRAFEDSVTEVLVSKTREALENLAEVKTLIIAGGVSANTHIAEAFQKLVKEYPDVTLKFPTRELSTDNAIMIGIAGFVKVSLYPQLLHSPSKLIAEGNLSLNTKRVL